MLIDLAFLIGIGIVAEALAIGLLYRNNTMNPTFVVAVLIILISCTRWGIKGIVSAPIMAITTWLCGKLFLDTTTVASFKFYEWQTLVATLAGNLSIGFICLVYRKYSYDKLYVTATSTMGVTVLVLVLVLLVEAAIVSITGRAQFALMIIVNNLIGCVITIAMVIALNYRGILVNVKQKIIADRKRAEEEAQYEREFMRSLNEEKKD